MTTKSRVVHCRPSAAMVWCPTTAAYCRIGEGSGHGDSTYGTAARAFASVRKRRTGCGAVYKDCQWVQVAPQWSCSSAWRDVTGRSASSAASTFRCWCRKAGPRHDATRDSVRGAALGQPQVLQVLWWVWVGGGGAAFAAHLRPRQQSPSWNSQLGACGIGRHRRAGRGGANLVIS